MVSLIMEDYAQDTKKLTLSRYSIARSGLKKAALMARVISSLAKPMLSIWAITGSLREPLSSVEGSLKVGASADGWAPAGEGVAGAAWAAVLAEGAGAAGAGGAAGVEAGALAGVDGA